MTFIVSRLQPLKRMERFHQNGECHFTESTHPCKFERLLQSFNNNPSTGCTMTALYFARIPRFLCSDYTCNDDKNVMQSVMITLFVLHFSTNYQFVYQCNCRMDINICFLQIAVSFSSRWCIITERTI